MKSATTHEPAPQPSHSSPTTQTPTSAYATRIRKPKRRTMPSAPSSRNRTRASDQSNSPSNPSAPSNAPSDSVRTSKDNTPDSSHRSPEYQSTKENAWGVDELKRLGKLVLEQNTISSSQLFPSPNTKKADMFPGRSFGEMKTLVDGVKKGLGGLGLSFLAKCNANEFSAALFSHVKYLTCVQEEKEQAEAKLAKVRADRAKLEKSNAKLLRERKFLEEEIEKERVNREKITDERTARKADLEIRKRKCSDQIEETAALRDELHKARVSDLDIRRRLDRMRLKVAALRGEMISPTVDQLLMANAKWAQRDESITSIEGDPLRYLLGDATEKVQSKLARDIEAFKDAEHQVEPMEGIVLGAVKLDGHEYDEDAEETQLLLLRNRLAMCENEAKEWENSLECEKLAVKYATVAKARLDEDVARVKQQKSASKGNNAARAAARSRAQARASFIPHVGDIHAKKTMRKGRKGRPRRSLLQ